MKVKDLTKNEAVSLLELIHEATLCDEEPQLQNLITKLNSIVPFEMAGAMLGKEKRDKSGGTTLIATTNYPVDFVNEYSARCYHVIDPTAMDALSAYGVTYWADSLKRHGKPNQLFSLLLDFGLKDCAEGHGYGCGVKNLKGNEKGIIAFSGLPRKERHETLLSLISPHIHEAMSRILRKSGSNLPPLSTREKEILQWLVEGKSTWDVSTILQISERTVKFHIDNVMKKLDAVNRTHAVAIALRERLIELD